MAETQEPRNQTALPALSADQRDALRVLGYLFLRMGQYERARLLFSAMATLDPADTWARRNMAAICLALGDPREALDHLRAAVGNGPLASRDAVLHLLRAQALWRQGREAEARSAVDAYLALTGEPDSRQPA